MVLKCVSMLDDELIVRKGGLTPSLNRLENHQDQGDCRAI